MRAVPSRIEEARHRASVAKQATVALAAAGFLAVLLLARGSHAGASHVSSTSATNPSSGSGSGSTGTSTESNDEFDYGSPSVAPSTAATQAQTSVS
jgi:hypothetical protein